MTSPRRLVFLRLYSLVPDRGTWTKMPTSFGSRLRWWRARRGRSQLDLASAAGTTQRHVSFLESGRTGVEERNRRCLHALVRLGAPLASWVG